MIGNNSINSINSINNAISKEIVNIKPFVIKDKDLLSYKPLNTDNFTHYPSVFTPLDQRVKTIPVDDAEKMGNESYVPCPLNKHIKSVRYLKENPITPDIISNIHENKSTAMTEAQVKEMVAKAYENGYEIARNNGKNDSTLLLHLPGSTEYPQPVGNDELTYSQFLKAFYTEVHHQDLLFNTIDSPINFSLYANFPEESNNDQTNIAINQINSTYKLVENATYINDIRQYIHNYKKICEFQIQNTEGRNIVNSNKLEIENEQLQNTTVQNNTVTEENNDGLLKQDHRNIDNDNSLSSLGSAEQTEPLQAKSESDQDKMVSASATTNTTQVFNISKHPKLLKIFKPSKKITSFSRDQIADPTLSTNLINSNRNNQQIKKNILMLQDDTPHAAEYNETIRRLKIKTRPEILEKLNQVTDDDLDKVQELCNNPSSMLKQNLPFLKNKNTAYALLQAFKLEQISRFQFSTLMGIYNETQQNDAVEYLELYYTDEQTGELIPNESSWDIIRNTLSSLYEKANNQIEYIQSYEEFIKTLQDQMKTTSPIERSLISFKNISLDSFLEQHPRKQELTTNSVRNALLETAFPIFSTPKKDNTILALNYTIISKALKNAFRDNALELNPVLGGSSADDIRKGTIQNYRDIGIQFPGNEYPDTVHDAIVISTVDIPQHDIYHATKQSYASFATRRFDLRMAEGFKKIADSYTNAIKSLLDIAMKKDLVVNDPVPANIINISEKLNELKKIYDFLKVSEIESKKFNFLYNDADTVLINEDKSTVTQILNTRIKTQLRLFRSHDKSQARELLLPSYMKQLCGMFCLGLKEEFDIFSKKDQDNFLQIASRAIWDNLDANIKKIEKVRDNEPWDIKLINQTNFLYCLHMHLLHNYPQEKPPEDTIGLLVPQMISNQKDQGINTQDKNGNTYLHKNIHKISLKNLQKKIHEGARLDLQNHEGDTILHLLTKIPKIDRQEAHFNIMKKLISKNIPLNTQNNKGETALHCEVQNSKGLMNARYLVYKGLDSTIVNSSSMTAMSFLLQNNMEKLKKYNIENLEQQPVELQRKRFAQYALWETAYTQ